MFRSIVTVSITAAVLAGGMLATSAPAMADGYYYRPYHGGWHHGGWGNGGAFATGAAFGLVGGALLARPAWYAPPPRPVYYVAPRPVYYAPQPACTIRHRFVPGYWGGRYVTERICPAW